MRTRRLFPLVVALCGVACEGGDLCTTSVEPSIVVTIREAGTGAPLAEGAHGSAVARGGVDKGGTTLPLVPHGVHGGSMISRRAGEEVSGVFTVRVAHAGYLNWERTGVLVPDLGCHVGTVQLTAELVPEVGED